mgnify:CR=1 FL=1
MKSNMEYRYLKNLKDKKAHKFTDPLSVQKKKPTFSDKAKFRAWCADEKTDHVFYSTVEGDNPSLRIQSDNPPNAISGIALVGALTLSQDTSLQMVIAFLAITFASINVFGGYLVTNRMLSMFKKK